jgi:hypothetical protein
MASPSRVPAVAGTPDRADRPVSAAVVVAGRASGGWHDHPSALGRYEVADEAVREVVATRIGHGDVVPRITDRAAKLTSRAQRAWRAV